jgi:hypothetical protein
LADQRTIGTTLSNTPDLNAEEVHGALGELETLAEQAASVAGVALGWDEDTSKWLLSDGNIALFRSGIAAGLRFAGDLVRRRGGGYSYIVGMFTGVGETAAARIPSDSDEFYVVDDFHVVVETAKAHHWYTEHDPASYRAAASRAFAGYRDTLEKLARAALDPQRTASDVSKTERAVDRLSGEISRGWSEAADRGDRELARQFDAFIDAAYFIKYSLDLPPLFDEVRFREGLAEHLKPVAKVTFEPHAVLRAA